MTALATLADDGSHIDGAAFLAFFLLFCAAVMGAAVGRLIVRTVRTRYARGRTLCALCDTPLTVERERWWGLCNQHHAAITEAVRRYGP